MLYAYVRRFDVTGTVGNFSTTKQGLKKKTNELHTKYSRWAHDLMLTKYNSTKNTLLVNLI